MKHRDPSPDATPTSTTVTEMLGWKAPAHISTRSVRASNAPIDPREKQVFTVAGDLWRIIMEDDDCDFHLEITSPGESATSDRVIVEVPQGQPFESTRQAILQKLAEQGVKFPASVMKKSISLIPTAWPARQVLRLIFLR